MGRRSTVILLAAVLVLAGCGASQHRALPQTGAALAAAVRTDNPGGMAPSKYNVRCRKNACTIAWNDGLNATNGWAVVLPTLVDVAVDVPAVRQLVIRIRDSRSRRAAMFTCDPKIVRNATAPASTNPHAAHNLPGCLEFDRRLT
jgi:hypothetical protein